MALAYDAYFLSGLLDRLERGYKISVDVTNGDAGFEENLRENDPAQYKMYYDYMVDRAKGEKMLRDFRITGNARDVIFGGAETKR